MSVMNFLHKFNNNITPILHCYMVWAAHVANERKLTQNDTIALSIAQPSTKYFETCQFQIHTCNSQHSQMNCICTDYVNESHETHCHTDLT